MDSGSLVITKEIYGRHYVHAINRLRQLDAEQCRNLLALYEMVIVEDRLSYVPTRWQDAAACHEMISLKLVERLGSALCGDGYYHTTYRLTERGTVAAMLLLAARAAKRPTKPLWDGTMQRFDSALDAAAIAIFVELDCPQVVECDCATFGECRAARDFAEQNTEAAGLGAA